MRHGPFLVRAVLILVATSQALCAQDDAKEALRRKLKETRVTLSFDNKRRMDHLVGHLARQAGINLLLDPNATHKYLPVSGWLVKVGAHDAPVLEVLEHLPPELGLRIEIRNDVVLLTNRSYPEDLTPPAIPWVLKDDFRRKRISASFEGVVLPDMLRKLSKPAGREIRLDVRDEYILLHPLTLELKDVSLLDWLDVLCCFNNLTWTVRDGAIVLTDRTTPIDLAIQKRIEETRVSFTFTDQPIMEAMDFLQTLGNTSIVPGKSKFEDPDRKITLTLKDVPLKEACDKLCAPLGLRCVVRDGAVQFLTEAEITALDAPRRPIIPIEKRNDADRKTIMKLRETIVSFTFTDQPVMEAFDFLRSREVHGPGPDRHAETCQRSPGYGTAAPRGATGPGIRGHRREASHLGQ